MERQQLEHWLQTHLPLSPFVSPHAVQDALGWSAETLENARIALCATVPFYTDRHQWVNPWAPVGPDELIAHLCPTGYLSGEWALSWHGCLSQQPTRLLVVDDHRPPMTARALTPQWSFECVPCLFDEPPALIARPALLPIATAGQALFDWAAYRWQRLHGTPAQLANFVDDCDREVVEAELADMARNSTDAQKRRLARLILEWWPDDSRWPRSPA